MAYDQARTAHLEERGYRVIRFTNERVENHLGQVLEQVIRHCEET